MFENATKKNRFIYLLQVMIFALFVSGCDIVSSRIDAVIKVSSTQVYVGENVAFDASSSSGGKGKIVSYLWKDASGSILSKNVTFNHAFSQSGKHTVSLMIVNYLNESSKATVEINVLTNDTDTIAPVITLNGDANITLNVGDTYTEAGATAVDDRDGNVSVDVSGSVDSSKVGTYTLTYTAKDKANNTSQISRVVQVVLPADTTPPVITLNGDANITLNVGDTYTEAGATAVDDRDGNVSVDVNGTVDVNTPGDYIIVYSAVDKAGNKSQKERIVRVQDANNVIIEELKELLNNPSIPYTTDADFNNTEYAKHYMDDEESKRLERAHMLVATAKDPDPEWFYTDVDKSVIVTDAGTEHTITLKKMRKDGTVYAPVDNDKLRLIVRIQRSKDEFEYITNVNIDQYAHWDGAGILKINVPQDLDKGRMIVGVRPNFDDVATTAIAERWSTVVVAEVWQTKQGVISPSIDNVLFPIDDATKKGLSSESRFTLETIGARLKVYFEDVNSTLFFPMVVKDMNLKKDDLVSYTFQGTPYAGKVIEITTIDNQDFVLLAPTLFDVYDITDAEDGFMIKQGLYPENVIIREGDILATDKNESDPIEFKTAKNILLDTAKYFNQHCTEGQGSLTMKTTFSLDPLDVGIDVGLFGLNKETKCTWEASASKLTLNPAYFAVGGPVAVVMSALGLHGTLEPYGTLELVAKDALGVGLEAGYSYQKGAQFNLLYPTTLGSRDLMDEAQTATAEIGSEFGLKYTVAALDPEIGLGWVLSFVPGMSVTNIGAEGKSGIKAGLAMLGKNASEVKKSGSSELAISLSSEIGLKLTESLSNWLIYFDMLESTHEIKLTVNLIEPLKTQADFWFSQVKDNGQGIAQIEGLLPESYFLHKILPSPLGVLSIDNISSSVYNDKSEAIEYSLDECDQNPDYKIVSPAIACAGWMCGVVNKEVELCKGKLSISDVYASARVGQLASTGGSVINKAGNLTVHISGSPLVPQTTTFQMPADSAEYIVFESQCTSAGTVRGKTTVTADGIGLSAEGINVRVCYDDENKGDPHITTGDGLGYDYFASGDYILSRILDADGSQVNGYEIQARFLPGFQTSWPQAVALNVGGDRVEIQGIKTDGHGDGSGVIINALSIWVNGEKYFDESGYSRYQSNSNLEQKIIKLPAGGIIAITETKSSLVLTYPTSMTIIWPEGSAVENYGLVVNVADAPNEPFMETLIARPDDFAGQERGLLGNNDGDPKNDFIRRNGEVLGVDHNLSFTELYALFGADWLVRPYESLFRNPEAIKPQFPTDVITLTPEQRALGEEACGALTGFYREACIMDVGLTGSAEIVKEYYANTEDLNELSDVIVVPDVDRAHYTMNVGSKSYEPDSGYYLHYKQNIDIFHTAGEGQFMLLVRPPRGATVMLGTGETSHTGEGNFSTVLEVDCTAQNSATDSDFLQKDGAVQLWLQDPLSGTANHLVSQEPLVCTDASKRADFRLSLGVQEEKADSNETHLHYTQPLSITHTNSYAGEYILELTPPSNGAVLMLNGSSTELNVTGANDYNATIELDCTQVVYDSNYTNGSIKLWEKDKLSGQKAYLYSSVSLSCKKGKILKTGQTVSYADFDDGYYQKGTERSYSRDDAKEIVTDNVTQLQWQDNEEAKTMMKTWQGAKDYCEALELGGYSDWRLPNRKELVGLSDYGRYFPAINPAFTNVASYYYWSSTTYAGRSDFAWYVYFYYGRQYYDYKTYSDYVRCVRAGQ